MRQPVSHAVQVAVSGGVDSPFEKRKYGLQFLADAGLALIVKVSAANPYFVVILVQTYQILINTLY
jgi:hypothetical protein